MSTTIRPLIPQVNQFNPFDHQPVLRELMQLLQDVQFDLDKPQNASLLNFLHQLGIQHYWVATHSLELPLVATGLFTTQAIEKMYLHRQSNPAFCADFEAYIKDWLE